VRWFVGHQQCLLLLPQVPGICGLMSHMPRSSSWSLQCCSRKGFLIRKESYITIIYPL
jgi:hypothetical protein